MKTGGDPYNIIDAMRNRHGSEPPVVYNVGIVGGGPGCIAILEMVHSNVMKHFRMNVRGVCDINAEAPGMIAAKKLGVKIVTTAVGDLFEIDDLNMIIEVTGRNDVRDEVFRNKPENVELIDHTAARLLWDLYETHLEKIEADIKAKRTIREERNRVKQIFNNLPDAILVIDLDMRIRDTNQTFLDINKLKEEDVIGKFCYEVENRLRGECQITEEYCLFNEVVSMKAARKSIQRHVDKSRGEEIFASTSMSPMLDEKGNVVGIIEASRDISYRIKLEEELVQSKIRLEKFMESAPFFIALKNLAGQYIQINQRGCKDLGLDFKDIIAHTDLEILPRNTAEMIRKNDHEVIKNKKELVSQEMIERDGQPRYYHTIRFPILDQNHELSAICMIAQDITVLKETQFKLNKKQHELEDTKEYLQSILENSTDIIITTDLNENIVSFNRGAEKMTGYNRYSVMGKPASLLYIDPADRSKFMSKLADKNSITGLEVMLKDFNGNKIFTDATISKLYDNTGTIIGTVEIFRDVTTRKQLQEQLIRTDRLAAIGKLGAGVAHEINNPTAVIGEAVGWISELVASDKIMRKSGNYDEFMSTIGIIKKQAARITDITHRLLGFASQTESTPEKVDINHVVDEVIKFTSRIKGTSNVKLHKHFAEDLPSLNLNEIQLQQVFVNIVDNAVDSIRGNGNITITTSQEGDNVLVTISDDGPGIDPQVLDRIFDPFVSTKPVGKGTGLGLSICYGIIKQMGGSIQGESMPGAGATFTISLPVIEHTDDSDEADAPGLADL